MSLVSGDKQLQCDISSTELQDVQAEILQQKLDDLKSYHKKLYSTFVINKSQNE